MVDIVLVEMVLFDLVLNERERERLNKFMVEASKLPQRSCEQYKIKLLNWIYETSLLTIWNIYLLDIFYLFDWENYD